MRVGSLRNESVASAQRLWPLISRRYARTKLKGAERELRNTAAFATGGFLAQRRPRPPDPLLPSKLPTVRRAHTQPAELDWTTDV
jgi:hypothetical protein